MLSANHLIVQSVFLLLLQLNSGFGYTLTITGSLALNKSLPDVMSADSITKLQNEVKRILGYNLEIPSFCMDAMMEFRPANGSHTAVANYTVSIDQASCSYSLRQPLTIHTQSEVLGISSVSIQSKEEAAFWRDKMNSILVFAGCGILLIIVLVTCTIMVCKVHKREMFDKEAADRRVSSVYEPYAADTMIMDVSTKHRRSADTTTIERWVHSQLGKGKKEPVKPKPRPVFTFKKTGSQQDLSPTDSGIVTTAVRREMSQNSPTAMSYTVDCEVVPDIIGGQYRKVGSSANLDSCQQSTEAAHTSLGVHVNEGYASDGSDHSSLEESSKL